MLAYEDLPEHVRDLLDVPPPNTLVHSRTSEYLREDFLALKAEMEQKTK